MGQYKTIDNSINKVKACIAQNNDSEYKNIADTYLPIGPQHINKHQLDWTKVNKVIIENLYRLELTDDNWEDLRNKLIINFSENRETRDLVDLIDQLFLSNNIINDITPLAYLVSNSEKITARTKTMMNIFNGLLLKPLDNSLQVPGNNPLETLIIEKLYSLCRPKISTSDKISFLPFLAQTFTKDIHYLSKSPSYFLDEFESLLKIYSFLYLIQLTINLCVPNFRYQEPQPRKLYFILETERASKERHECNEYGYEYIFSKTRGVTSRFI